MSPVRLAIVLVLAAVLVLSMLVFRSWMPGVIEDWRQMDKQRTPFEWLMARITIWYGQYWYLPLLATLAGALLALLVPVPERTDSKH